jgi:sugar phosphate isomerase/epimerase
VSDLQLCLNADQRGRLSLESKVQIAGQTGYSGLEVPVSELEATLASLPSAWLDSRLQAHRIHTLIVGGVELPLGSSTVDVLLARARFLELCTYLDAMGGGILAVRFAGGEGGAGGAVPAVRYLLRGFADLAAPYEVSIAYEAATEETAGVEAAYEIVQQAARTNLGLALNASSLGASGADIRLEGSLSPATLKLVRLKARSMESTESRPAEEGIVGALCARLARTGFRGPYSVEPVLGAASPREGATAARKWALDLLASQPEGKETPNGQQPRRRRWRLSRSGPAR